MSECVLGTVGLYFQSDARSDARTFVRSQHAALNIANSRALNFLAFALSTTRIFASI